MPNNIKILTDVSKMNNLVPCDFVVFDNNNQEIYYIMIKINNEATIFMAEMTAIREVVNYAINYFKIYTVFLVTDSLSSLLSFTNEKENRIFIQNIRYNLGSHSNICLRWTKAIVGNKHND